MQHRNRNVLFVVDAIQQAGAFPVDVKASLIHAMAACSHKWMPGLLGIGFLYVDRDLLPNLRPALVGWHSVEDPFAFDGTRFDLRTDASRLEEAAPVFPMVYGLGAAVEMPPEAGVANTAAHIAGLLDHAAGGLEAIGCDVSPALEHRAGILMVKPRSANVDALAEACTERNIAVSVRRGRLRLSAHLYNNRDDIDALELLREPFAEHVTARLDRFAGGPPQPGPRDAVTATHAAGRAAAGALAEHVTARLDRFAGGACNRVGGTPSPFADTRPARTGGPGKGPVSPLRPPPPSRRRRTPPVPRRHGRASPGSCG